MINFFCASCSKIFSARPHGREVLTLIKNTLLLFFAVYILFFLFSFLPQEPLRKHLQEAASAGYFEDNYPKPDWLHLISPRLDMYTECVGIGIATTMQPNAESLLFMNTFGECSGLLRATTSDFTGSYPYMRYVHGYQLFLKPLYTFFSIENVRLLTFCITSALLLLLLGVLKQSLNFSYALAIVLTFFVTQSANVFLIVTHAAQFWVVLGGAALAVLLRHRLPPLVLFGLLGAVDALCSFLNMGSLSLGLPLLCYSLSLWSDGRTSTDIIAAIFWGSVGWAVAFVLPWLLKWSLLEIFYQPSREQLFGVTLEKYPNRSFSMIFLAFYRNVIHLHWLLGLVLYALLFKRWRKLRPTTPAGLWPALLPALIPIVWIGILPGQSGIKHASFINLILWPGIAATVLMLLALPRPRTQLETQHVSNCNHSTCATSERT